ncbi:MAG: glycosyltransferase family 39 protein [Rhodospirillales bacterium]|nr:glycosyltransferase family 39 protein [Rhodospirillales bacterium]
MTAGIWLLLMAVALVVRPPLPVDETRYLAVAWEMWLRGDFLVPYLNDETYSHKPPLLFWLMHAGWALLGVNDWWPRLIAPLFGLGCLFLTRALARALWPADKQTPEFALLVLTGCVFWTLFVTLTMFDMMLAFFALLGLLGMIRAWQGRRLTGFALLAAAVGLGILCKGPAILLHLLPVALTAPLWGPRLAGRENLTDVPRAAWYGQLVIAIALGIGLALLWAVPAGIAGGDDYQHAIFWGQAAGRMVESFAHKRAFWWYAAIVPGLVLPWFIWPPLWQAARAYGRRLWQDGGSLLCLIWFMTAFFVFSLISGKQLHYLLPEFPALALLAARALSQSDSPLVLSRASMRWPALLFAGLGLALLLLSFGLLPGRMPDWAGEVAGLWSLGLVGLAGWVGFSQPKALAPALIRLTVLPVGLVVALHLALAPVFANRYDLEPVAIQLKAWQDEGIAIANFGKYHGQFQFLGRLHQPVTTVGQRSSDLQEFLRDNPRGRIIAYYDEVPSQAIPVAVYRFRQSVIVIWDAQTMIAYPGIGNRS